MSSSFPQSDWFLQPSFFQEKNYFLNDFFLSFFLFCAQPNPLEPWALTSMSIHLFPFLLCIGLILTIFALKPCQCLLLSAPRLLKLLKLSFISMVPLGPTDDYYEVSSLLSLPSPAILQITLQPLLYFPQPQLISLDVGLLIIINSILSYTTYQHGYLFSYFFEASC